MSIQTNIKALRPEDRPSRQDWNDAMAQLAAALTALDAADSGLSGQIAALDGEKCQVVLGSYQGNDSTQTISLPITPKVLLLTRVDGTIENGGWMFGGFFLAGGTYQGVIFNAQSFQVSNVTQQFKQYNDSNYTYRYAVLG